MVSKENRDVELEEEEDFGNGAIIVVSATSSISSASPIKQNLPSTSTTIQPSSSESSNKTLRGQTSRGKMEGMLGSCITKRIQYSQKFKPKQIQRKKNFTKTY